jgi:hypothetical protein
MAKSYKKKKSSYTKKKYRTSRFRGGCGSCLLKGGKGSRKKRGGDFVSNSVLAYPRNSPVIPHIHNPSIAFTGKTNIHNAYPNHVQKPPFMNWLNPINQNGGKYPNGLTGESWTSSVNTWPGVNGVDGDSNHYELNTYDNDVSRQMIDVGPAAPYVVGGKRRQKYRKNKRSLKKGGLILEPNSFLQDAVNVGRQFKTGMGSIYNGLNGVQAPTNPLPWKGQLVNSNNVNYLKYNK